jgi:Ni,Fe-hydrogenase III component G
METEKLFTIAEALLKPWAKEYKRPDENRLDVYLSRDDLLESVKELTQARWGYLSAISGVDIVPPDTEGEKQEGHLEVLYHFCNSAAVLSLRIDVPYSDAQVSSVCGIIPSATIYERELIELFGITVVDTPVPDHLLLPDDWPDGVYPLRKSFTGFNTPKAAEES